MEKLTHDRILEFEGKSGNMKPLDPDYLTHLDQDAEENVDLGMELNSGEGFFCNNMILNR